MNFKSPPPHRRSSGATGGRGIVPPVLRDFDRYVKKYGYSKIPLHDETLRPLLGVLWRVQEQVPEVMVVCFDLGKGDEPITRLYPGLQMPVTVITKVQTILTEELKSDACRAIALASPGGVGQIELMLKGGQGLAYHKQLWCPADALGKRRN
jgi:hypothetical protein